MPLVLAPIGGVMMALFALLLVFGIALLADLLLRSIDSLSIPGFIKDPLRWVARGIVSATNAVVGWLASVGRGALSFITAPAVGFVKLVNSVAHAFSRIGNWLRWLIYTEVPRLWGGISNAIQSLSQLASNWAQWALAQALARIGQVAASLSGLIAARIAEVIGFANRIQAYLLGVIASLSISLQRFALSLHQAALAAVAAATAALTTLIMSVRGQLILYAQQLAQWAVNTAIGISIDWARKYADQLIDLYNRAIAGAGAIAIDRVWPGILDVIDSLALAIPESVAAVLAKIGALPRVIPRDIGAQIGILAAVGAVALDWVSRCGMPMCRNLFRFGDEVAALDEEIMIAALLSVIATAVRDPRDVAGDVISVLGSDVNGVAHDFTNILSTVD